MLDFESFQKVKVRCTLCGRITYHELRRLNTEKRVLCTCETGCGKYDGEEWIGKRYGYLKILRKNRDMFTCECDCGRIVEEIPVLLVNGTIKSCGKSDCKYHNFLITNPETHGKHGLSGERLYKVYRNMINRCENPKNKNYKNYGGRGISICKEWRSDFVLFYNWSIENGYDKNAEQGECTIDRIDNDGNYCPENCRWVNMEVQNNNRRPTSRRIQFTINGITKDVIDWCEEYNVSVPFVQYRIKKKGMTPYEALTSPKETIGRPKKQA